MILVYITTTRKLCDLDLTLSMLNDIIHLAKTFILLINIDKYVNMIQT